MRPAWKRVKIAALVLAAGASTRLGKPKQLVRWGDESLLERAVRIAIEAGCTPVIVILGADAAAIRSDSMLRGATVIENHAWQEGVASTIRMGVLAAAGCDGVLLMTCDQPAVDADHLRKLMAAQAGVVASGYAGRLGVPALFMAEHFPALLLLREDQGARELLRGATEIPLLHGELDVDTVEDLQKLRKVFGA